MPAKHLTDTFLQNVKTRKGEKQTVYTDTMQTGLALVLVVSYGGAKTFRVMTYVNGKARTKKLG
jgi:hypothetical protein